MKLQLTVGLKQTLAPQLIQSLKMLQMPTLKLEQTLRHELAANPMLEEIETLEQEPEEDKASETEKESEELIKDDGPEIDPRLNEIDWDTYLNDDHDYKIEKSFTEPRAEILEQTSATQKTLYDHIREQLHLLKISEEELLIGEYILGNLDPRGFLVVSVPDMAAELKIPPDKIESTLKIMQGLDPVGVCARDLRESLLLQLADKDLQDTLAYRVVNERLYDLEKKSALQVGKMMGVSVEKIQDAMDIIRTLSPTPARGKFDAGAMPVTPDLIVERVGDDFVVLHNDHNLPRMRINPSYRTLLKRKGGGSEDTKQYVREKLEQARWLLNSINQRRDTMVRVMRAIVGEQREFFDKGPAFLRPLIMEDIARIVDMNVATISRVSNGKYVQTPHGVYELKYFFNSGITRDDGVEVSKRNVKAHLAEIIAAEDPVKPLSDQDIFRRLNGEGYKLARRTVTKYREELKILPARFRKRVTG
ncbi:MAG: RNA polymerase factor sigma-54 [candidate division Zixibacteria bacterium]|nr:RNA polymerase factor sigma-54 [candidate division Zixibacteria bacterium]